jgi:hypothetical protein
MVGTTKRSAGTRHTQRGPVQGEVLVDPITGLPIDVIVDGTGKRRLAVDAALSIDSVSVEVDLDFIGDGVHIGDRDSGYELRIESDGSINTNTEIDASDGDNISISGHQFPIFDEASDTITTANYETIYTYTSISNDTRVIKLESYVSTSALIRLKINGTVKKQFNTSSLERNAKFKFDEPRPLNVGDVVTIEAKVDRSIKPSYDTFTSLEGYLD